MSVLIDSDILIEVLRGRDQAILARWVALAESSAPILISPIALAEVGAGAFENEIDKIARLFAPLTCVPIDRKIGQRAGEFLSRYGKSHGLKIADALVAAAAIQSQSALWTRNRKHYPMPELCFYA